MKKIVIQGIRGAFHEVAARTFFGSDIDVVPALSFRALFDIAEAGNQCDAAILAIENNLAGSILGNYKLLSSSHQRIVGEVFLPIRQNLMALPGVEIADLNEVRSHPMALAQCSDFFQQFPHIRLVESDDTAASAERVARRHTKHIGAIASELAADIYGLRILAGGIEDNPMNYTRFLALLPQNRAVFPENADKTSICFVTPHQPGALAKALNLMADLGANLTKIQSVPIEEKVWEYRFFLDYTFDRPEDNANILRQLDKLVSDLVVLGTYKADNMEDKLALHPANNPNVLAEI